MKKKGISPLIATVLIIGFTVALAAIIMSWGVDFVNIIKGKTTTMTDEQIICATDVNFDIKSVCKSGTNEYTLLIGNDGKIDIERWIIRFYSSETDVGTKEGTSDVNVKLEKFRVGKLVVTAPSEMNNPDKVNKIEAVPTIRVKGKELTCIQRIDSYGDEYGSVISACT